jgi:hypothetical protein
VNNVTTLSIQVTLDYNVNYTIEINSVNCAGNSNTSSIDNIRYGKLFIIEVLPALAVFNFFQLVVPPLFHPSMVAWRGMIPSDLEQLSPSSAMRDLDL